nr:response regulator [Desulfotalea psychrophila]
MGYKIVLVEDDDVLRANYSQALEREGYVVSCYASRLEAERAFVEELPDLAVLDIMLGEEMEGGFEVCRHLRQLSPTIPIIFLTARNSDLDRVSGLRLGAWDYLTKDTTTLDFLPVRISTLFKVIESLQRPKDDLGVEVHSGSLRMNEDRKQVFWQGQQVNLTLTEFWLLYSLARRPGHVKSHDQLMGAANIIVTNNAIAAHIRRIRDKFRELDDAFDAIRTEYGMGYRWVLDDISR